ncbi:Por secretion system C-terminal sorting domain-containing protein [Polaribacter sp. KT25b]|uniref:T9SS type A sorting domain-containing protein n=1 Tax=Polaribacter sp. KT25b TaxID=1855336 RepID=UPI00087A2515|nr:T9SS type A sorting domain-containing protein [Polaribacter sp. KT25b]SDR70799.1 Por secretion system C-terminal sorting domain-containing protein [Polaribacter sp. KT25b]
MKKIYFTLLISFLFVASISAQTTIYNSTFDEASYDDAGVVADLNAHADWLAGHFNNASTWVSNADADLISTGANFAYSLLSSTPITGASGDVITIRTVYRVGNDDQPFNTDETFGTAAGDVNMFVSGLSPNNAPASSDLGQLRDGVLFKSVQTGSVELTSSGGSSFATNPSISTADKAAYEIIFEYTLGDDAASTTKSARLTNIGSSVASTTETSTGIKQEIYDALTGSGAYFFNWALGFYTKGNSTINALYQNSLTITKNGAVLSTKGFNNFHFSMSPNPVNDVLTINTKETLKKVEIFNLLGKRVLSSTKNSVDVSSLSTSVYLVKISSDKGVSTKKLIKN